MNKKGTRRSNGEGSVFDTIQKIKRKKKLDHECDICKNCNDRTLCDNRTGTKKCAKCESCTECLKNKNYCDRFYCYYRYQAQISIDKKQTTVANATKRKEAVDKKLEVEAKVQTNAYVKKNGITILEVIKKVDDAKFESGKIGTNTKTRNQYIYKHIESYEAFKKPVQKITYQDINNFLNSLRYLSQSEINRVVTKLKVGFMECILDKIISYSDNPMLRITIPVSFKARKKIEAFEVDEQRILMKYIRTQPLLHSSLCNYNEETVRNLLICLFLTGARIGELCALKYQEDIDFKNGGLVIRKTLTQDGSKILMGKTTKTGNKKVFKNKIDERFVPFDLFDENLLINTIKKQIKIAKFNFKNKEHLLFCKLDGSYIDYRQINSIFKRICREAHVKNNIAEGCHIHMCRHTATTRMLEAGMDLLVIANILGHSDDRQIKETYGHILTQYKNKQLKNSQDYYKKERLTS